MRPIVCVYDGLRAICSEKWFAVPFLAELWAFKRNEKEKSLDNQGLRCCCWRRRREGAPVSTSKLLVLNNQNPTAFDGAFKHYFGTPQWITFWRTEVMVALR